MTVANLRQELAKGERLTVIDVRSPTLFARGHIPGAINVPASLCGQKKLPPLGKVVVCDEGLGRDATEAAATALAAKPGITVEVLEGGFAAWESAQATTTRRRGMEPETPNYITYAQLKAAKTDELVLVDLRKQPSKVRKLGPNDAAPSSEPLTDLNQEFPGMRVAHSAFETAPTRQSGVASPAPLLVLIDNGDGAAQAMARTLKANGVKRYVILAGGELILARHGQPGLQRSGSGSRMLNLSPPPPH
jgi:rhodanese-related sulfurtransferase